SSRSIDYGPAAACAGPSPPVLPRVPPRPRYGGTRAAARLAGVHLYTPPGLGVWNESASGDMLPFLGGFADLFTLVLNRCSGTVESSSRRGLWRAMECQTGRSRVRGTRL